MEVLLIKIIESTNIFNEKVNDYLEKRLHSNPDYLYLSADTQTLRETQKVIKEFCKILDNFISDSTIQNYDAEFFAKHLRNIIKTFEVENKKKNDFYLNFQNMLNLRHYKYVFFMGFELNKYPRKHNRRFPFTNEVIEIIRMLGIKSYDIYIYDYNITMEQFFFKNVLNIVDDSIWFTCTRQQTSNAGDFSLYAQDIASAFDSDLEFDCPYIWPRKDLKSRASCPSLYISSKNEYTLKELVTFELCPKLYYHLYINTVDVSYRNKNQLRLYAEAVMYSDLFGRFMDYNYENKKWYFIDNNNEAYTILNKLSD